MTKRINDITLNVDLYYSEKRIGHVTDLLFSDETWFGSFHTFVAGGGKDSLLGGRWASD
jgi:hypothetical protein